MPPNCSTAKNRRRPARSGFREVDPYDLYAVRASQGVVILQDRDTLKARGLTAQPLSKKVPTP
jgi:hypothetical protein